jgi:hypothetical protein
MGIDRSTGHPERPSRANLANTMKHAVLLLLFCWLTAAAAAAAEPTLRFGRDILPILSDHCFPCHGPDENARQAGLRLDLHDSALAAGDSGQQAIVPGDSAASEVIRRITASDADSRMPPADANRKLTPRQIELLKRWIDQGAAWGKYWAFEPPQRSPLPAVKPSSWPINAVDRFILARLDQEGLEPSPPATKEALLRRVTFDLTGLPPTLAEIDAFLADDSPRAYEKVVDRLLASPRYGERWCWDWLDAARYADTSGYQGDPERTMWPWRDWVVESINANMPYDQFTVEQLAGDLLPAATQSQILATGFHRNHMYNGEGGRIAEETRVENVFDRVETTGTVWLGLTIGCCRCHDHKFDPITQREYYQLYDYFNQTSEDGAGRGGQVKPVLDVATDEHKQQQAALRKRVTEQNRVVEALEEETLPRDQRQDASQSPAAEQLKQELREALKQPPRARAVKVLNELAEAFVEKAPEYSNALKKLRQAIDAQRKFDAALPRVMIMDQLAKPRESHILNKGAYDKPLERVAAGVPACLPPLGADEPNNRLALARWLVSREHPLTARVTVNRFWQAIFGTGLVKTVEDFGVQGEKPSHPELLDWLAVEFMEGGWNVKALHRLLVTSATYRQSSRTTEKLRERDPENRLLARGPRYRLPSWMIRDSALAASGLLVDKLGGPPVKPYQPAGIWEEATFGKVTYKPDSGDKLYRRTLYTFWRRIVGPTMLFDNSPRQVCMIKAFHTNTPLHALTTLNETIYVEAARALGERVLECDAASSDDDRLTYLFRLATSRRPKAQELEILGQRLATLRKQYAADPAAAASALAVGESKRNEQLDPIEHAAWTGVCSLVLNLDEVITRQ